MNKYNSLVEEMKTKGKLKSQAQSFFFLLREDRTDGATADILEAFHQERVSE
jgi:hypothetical protein